MIFSLWVFPLIFGWAYRNFDTKHVETPVTDDQPEKNN